MATASPAPSHSHGAWSMMQAAALAPVHFVERLVFTRRTMVQLAEFDERELHDIGLDRADVTQAASLSFRDDALTELEYHFQSRRRHSDPTDI